MRDGCYREASRKTIELYDEPPSHPVYAMMEQLHSHHAAAAGPRHVHAKNARSRQHFDGGPCQAECDDRRVHLHPVFLLVVATHCETHRHCQANSGRCTIFSVIPLAGPSAAPRGICYNHPVFRLLLSNSRLLPQHQRAAIAFADDAAKDAHPAWFNIERIEEVGPTNGIGLCGTFFIRRFDLSTERNHAVPEEHHNMTTRTLDGSGNS